LVLAVLVQLVLHMAEMAAILLLATLFQLVVAVEPVMHQAQVLVPVDLVAAELLALVHNQVEQELLAKDMLVATVDLFLEANQTLAVAEVAVLVVLV
jgi:hypothetical protein